MGAKLEALEADAMGLSEQAWQQGPSLSGDTEIEKAWSTEIKRRVLAIEAGDMTYVPAQEAIA